MAARVTVKTNFKPLKDLQLSTRDLMKEVGLLARERVIRRTLSGRDEDDRAFKMYSTSYAYRKFKETGSVVPNLQLSGAMLNAIVLTEVKDDSVTLGFAF